MNQISQNENVSNFKDHFSDHAATYAKYRPTYPAALFQFLASQCVNNSLAWDCATGSGQSAIALASHFNQVYASDASEPQISNAQPHNNVSYHVATAESSGLKEQSVNLICVAQAAHWFDIEAFYNECRRVSAKNGLVAIWCYELFSISEAIDNIVFQLYEDILGQFWPPERKIVESGYRGLPFPFRPITSPEFKMQIEWDLSQTMGYLQSWSACQKYLQSEAQNPLALIAEQLTNAWGNPSQKKQVCWPLSLKFGRVF